MPFDALQDRIRTLIDQLGYELVDSTRPKARPSHPQGADRPSRQRARPRSHGRRLWARQQGAGAFPRGGCARGPRYVFEAVEILEVPDGAHVRVRLPEGEERTLALADVIDANLDVDWNSIGGDRR